VNALFRCCLCAAVRGRQMQRLSEAYAAAAAQDVMYKPIGLECGHKFCADCAFTCGTPASRPRPCPARQ